jgi:Uma2 family endonuclease
MEAAMMIIVHETTTNLTPGLIVNSNGMPLPSAPISFAAFLDWVDEDTRAEWVGGEVVMASPFTDHHQGIRDFLVRLLGMYNDWRQLGWMRGGFFMHLATRPSGREPDLVFVRNQRLAIVQPTYLDGPADLVVEIVSPESGKRDRGDKFREYEAAGIAEYWLIDPLRSEALFYQLDAQGQYHAVLPDTNGIYHSTAVAGFWLKPAWFWQRQLPEVDRIMLAIGGAAYGEYLIERMRSELGDSTVDHLLK